VGTLHRYAVSIQIRVVRNGNNMGLFKVEQWRQRGRAGP